MTTAKPKDNLEKRIAEVTKSVGNFIADKRHEQQNYDYISADAILDRVGKAMAEAGMIVAPEVNQVNTEFIQVEGKKPFWHASVVFNMYISDVDGSNISRNWAGAGVDYTATDKAVYKAITSGHKYFLMKLFNIGIGNEDGEHDAPPKGDSPPQKPPQKAQKPQDKSNGKGETSVPQALVDAKIAENIPHAAEIINHMPNNFRGDVELAVSWGKKYRALRDEGHDVIAATELASVGGDK